MPMAESHAKHITKEHTPKEQKGQQNKNPNSRRKESQLSACPDFLLCPNRALRPGKVSGLGYRHKSLDSETAVLRDYGWLILEAN